MRSRYTKNLTGPRFFFIVIVAFHFISCTQSARLYRENSYETGTLNKQEFDAVKSFLAGIKSPVRDTIIIKYDFNRENCWSMLDHQSDDYIMGVVISSQSYVKQNEFYRPQLSVYKIKEKGINFNKLKRFDNTIETDRDGLLRKLIFKENTTCGTSCIILPSGAFLLVKSDSHFQALQFKEDKIASLLSGSKVK